MESEFVFRNANLEQCCFKLFVDMRGRNKFCDIKFHVGVQSISAHRVILAAAIPIFQEIFSEEEFSMPDIEPAAFKCLIDYAYSSELNINMGNVRTLLSAACLLRLKEVQDACCDFLSQRLNPENALNLREFAVGLNLTQLKECADDYVKEYFEEVSKTEGFLHCPFTYLRDLICNDELNVENEEKVFESVVRWVKASASGRECNLTELLRHVRMGLLKPVYLKDVVEREQLIRLSLERRDLVDEARNYNLFPERRKAVCSFATEARQFMKIYKGTEDTGGTIYSLDASIKYNVLHLDLARDMWSTTFTKEFSANSGSGTVLNKKMYFFHGSYTFEYDPARNRKRLLQPLLVPRKGVAAVSLRNKIFVCGGCVRDLVASNVVECFDPEKNEFILVNPLLTARYGLNAVSLGDVFYALGGEDDKRIYDSIERYNLLNGKWQYISSMLTPRSYFGSAVLNGKIYVCGGYTTKSEDESVGTAEVFDPLKNKWKFISSMNTARSELKLVAFCGKLYAIGGLDSNGDGLDSYEVYDPETNKWTYGAWDISSHCSSAAVAI